MSRAPTRLGAPTEIVGLLFLLQLPWTAAVIAVTLLWDFLQQPLVRSGAARWLAARVRTSCHALAPRMLRDERNAEWLWVIFGLGIIGPGLFAGMAWRQHGLDHFDAVGLFAYHTLLMGPFFRFFASFATLAHQHGHQKNGFFMGPWRWLDAYITYVMGFVYGHVPEQYSLGHVRIHHRYDNGPRDITSTARIARSAPSSLVDQLVRQLGSQSGVTVLLHHWQCGRRPDALRMARGMLTFYGLLLALALWDPRVGLGYVLLPHLSIVMLIGGVNFVQHAFVDPRDPDNPYRNSITILDGKRNVFNEDFHAAHHLEPQASWQDLPPRSDKDFERYRDEGAIVFRNTHVYEILFWILLGRRDLLARSLVDLGGTLSTEAKLALIDERLAYSR